VVERDEDGAIIVLGNGVLNVWNTTTFECTDTVPLTKQVWSMVKTRNNKSLVCGRKDGWIEIRRMNELGEIVNLFNVHGDPSGNLNSQLNRPLVLCICELTDGTFVSGAENALVRWNDSGVLLQHFSGCKDNPLRVIELKSDIIVSSSFDITQIWRVSTGVCLHLLSHQYDNSVGLVKLFDGHFVTATYDSFKVYNEKGECIERHPSQYKTRSIARLSDGSIISFCERGYEIRRRAEYV